SSCVLLLLLLLLSCYLCSTFFPYTTLFRSIFESAMLSEIFRAGLNAVPKGQMEAGLSTGLSYLTTMLTIVLPQAFRSMIPAIVRDRKSTRLNSSHVSISYAVFCLKKKRL